MRTVPGWWNDRGRASEEQIFESMVTLALGAEISPDWYGNTDLLDYMAEAFGRSAWGGEHTFYTFIGSRQSVGGRVMQTLYAREWDSEANNGKGEGYWAPDLRTTTFTELMDSDRPRYDALISRGRQIVSNTGWHRLDDNRPCEWANVMPANPPWFKKWVNVDAPMLSKGEKPLNTSPGSAIWYAARPNGRPLPPQTNNTLFVLTPAQSRALPCHNHTDGCIGLTNNDPKPEFIP